MVIVSDFGGSVQAYVAGFLTLVFYRPSVCPGCGAEGSCIGHIKRWYCKHCQHTISLLPSFLVCYRHYLLAVIQTVVIARFEDHASWAQLETPVAIAGAPSQRSMRRWCQSFAAHAPAWLAEVEQALATHTPSVPLLTPLGGGIKTSAAATPIPGLLLAASRYLLAWAQVHLAQARAYGSNDRLRFLWLWGHDRGLVRLI